MFAGPESPQAQQLSAGVQSTHAMSLLRVSKNTVFPKAVPKPVVHADKHENAVASPSQYAGRPGVPTACCIAHAEPLKHADTHELHVNNFAISAFAVTAVFKNAVHDANAQLTIVGVFPKCVNAFVASGVEKLIM